MFTTMKITALSLEFKDLTADEKDFVKRKIEERLDAIQWVDGSTIQVTEVPEEASNDVAG